VRMAVSIVGVWLASGPCEPRCNAGTSDAERNRPEVALRPSAAGAMTDLYLWPKPGTRSQPARLAFWDRN
jgi:hypothetical protein